MITLGSDYLLFRLSSGECVPFSAEMVSIELVGDASDALDPEIVKNAAAAVVHYFKKDLGREVISVAEFAGALEKTLRAFGFNVSREEAADEPAAAVADLRLLVHESGSANELFFLSRLREQIRLQLKLTPGIVRFRGLRGCVKKLAGARRWSPRCERMHDQILNYLRQCLSAETPKSDCMLVVE